MIQNNQSDFIDIRGLLKTYFSKWYYFVISVVIFACLGFVFTRIFKQNYQVVANVVISSEGADSGLGSLTGFGGIFGTSSDVEDEIFKISSHTVYEDVVKELHLNIAHYVRDGFLNTNFKYKDYPIQVYPASGITDTLKTSLLFNIKAFPNGTCNVKVKARKKVIANLKNEPLPVLVNTIYGKFVIDTTQYYQPDAEVKTRIMVMGYSVAAENLAEKISADIASKKSNVVRLGYKTPDPEYGEDVLNAIIANYNRRGIHVKNIQGEKTAAFIAERLAMIQDELATSENNIQEYLEKNGITDLVTETAFNFRKKSESEITLMKTLTYAEILKITIDFLSNPKNAYELLPMTEEIGTSLSSALETYNGMIIERIAMLNTAKSDNVSLKLLEERIDAMRGSILSSVEKTYDNTMLTIKDLQKQIGSASSNLSLMPEQKRAVLGLTRQQSVKQELFLHLLKSQEETALMLANAMPKAEIVDEAYTLNEPLGLSPKLWIILFMFLGLCVPPVVIYIQKLLRDKFATKEEVEAMTNAPVIGEICIDNSGEKLVVANRKTSSTAELFRLVRANLQFVLNSKNDKVILFTSTNSGEGKTYISINVASSLALLNKRVILLGMDIRKPRLLEYLGLPSHKGLTQYLSDPDISIDDIIIKDPLGSKLDLIVAGPVPPNPSELLQSEAVDNLFGKLREMYDYIVIDSAPVGMVSDSLTLTRVADAVVYVCRANYTTLKDIKYFNQIYNEGKLKKASLVVNGTKSKRGYGYGYGE